jgi:hypothetical protein
MWKTSTKSCIKNPTPCVKKALRNPPTASNGHYGSKQTGSTMTRKKIGSFIPSNEALDFMSVKKLLVLGKEEVNSQVINFLVHHWSDQKMAG